MLNNIKANKSGDSATIHSISSLENANQKLMENQAQLHEENVKLQSDLQKLASQFEEMRKISLDPKLKECGKKSSHNTKEQLKITHTNKEKPETTASYNLRESIFSAISDLDTVLSKIKSEKLDISPPPEEITDVILDLNKKLEDEEKKSDKILEALNKERDCEEKLTMREKIINMKDKITNLEVDNTKLRFQSDQLLDDLTRAKKQLERTEEDLKIEKRKNREYENEKDKLKDAISDTENDNLRLKREMIEELNEANRAKRISIDTEIALAHISEAYENKRQESMKYVDDIQEYKREIRNLKEQIEHLETQNKFIQNIQS